MTFSPDGRRILTAGIDGKLRLWHRDTGEELLVLDMDEFWLFRGSFSGDGNSIIAGNGALARVFPATAQDASLEFKVEPFLHLGCEY
jgi:WD40 repeat protein